MMSKTHLAVGIAASLMIVQPQTYQECALAVIGGALGGIAPDIDTFKSRTRIDNVISHTAAVVIAAAALFCDYYFNFGIVNYLRAHTSPLLVGGLAYIALLIIGFYAPHRGFTHSLLGMVLFTAAISAVYPPVAAAYMAGFASHIALDLLNRKHVHLFYPMKKGISFNLCYASGKANTFFFIAGIAVSAISLAGFITRIHIG